MGLHSSQLCKCVRGCSLCTACTDMCGGRRSALNLSLTTEPTDFSDVAAHCAQEPCPPCPALNDRCMLCALLYMGVCWDQPHLHA